MFLAHCWLGHPGTSCCWFAVLHNTRQHFNSSATAAQGIYYCLVPWVSGPAAKDIQHSQEPQQLPPAGRQGDSQDSGKSLEAMGSTQH